MRLLAILTIATLIITGCVTPRPTPQTAARQAFKAFGQNVTLAWIPGARTTLAGLIARAVLPADAPDVVSIKNVVSPASKQPVKLAVAGDDSAFTAAVIEKALGSVPDDLPHLQLLFIGNRTHEADVRSAVEAKRGKFLFEEQ